MTGNAGWRAMVGIFVFPRLVGGRGLADARAVSAARCGVHRRTCVAWNGGASWTERNGAMKRMSRQIVVVTGGRSVGSGVRGCFRHLVGKYLVKVVVHCRKLITCESVRVGCEADGGYTDG